MDLILALTILCLFVGLIGSFYYQIAFNNTMIRLNASAAYYAVKIAEDIDKLAYNEINNNLDDKLVSKYQIPEIFDVDIVIDDYNKQSGNTDKKDIIKTATINIKYNCFNKEINYKLQKLKIKER